MKKQKAIEIIADFITAETKGGYLQDWGEVSTLLSKEQQRDYFIGLGRIILKRLQKLCQSKE